MTYLYESIPASEADPVKQFEISQGEGDAPLLHLAEPDAQRTVGDGPVRLGEPARLRQGLE